MPCCVGFWRMGIHLLPLAVAIVMPVSFIATYVIAVLLNHVEAGFPYISDTGTYPPESCIFGQMMNFGALLIILTVHIRYKQIVEYYADAAVMNTSILRINKVSEYCGYLAGFGLSVVGNFQETNVIVVHIIGAIMAFGLGMVYAYLQSVVSYKMHPHVSHIAICHLRMVLSVLITVFFIMTIGSGVASSVISGQAMRSRWEPSDPGFTEHVLSTASEWLMSICMMIFFITFVGEFQKIHVKGPSVHILGEDFNPLENSISPRIT
ncbi:DNA damage-regulated autophagy modulator protein 2-like isoform X1 [Lineus longissimus]|uniref:DNA damage-regulated autophagy modulator protein 2-like isoform X1 n=1 Tax=Lineus longissimus TaxID=88925 RepID=UPI002B4D9DB5